MGNLFVSLIIIVIVFALLGLSFVIVNRKKKHQEEIIQTLAQEKGWRFEKVKSTHRDGFTLTGGEWSFESIAISSSQLYHSGSSTVSYHNRWFSDRFLSPDGMVLIGPKLPNVALGKLGDLLLKQALRLMLGEGAVEAEGLAELEVGRSALRERYSVWGTSQEVAEKVVHFNAENALLNWTSKELPVITVNSQGIEIKLKQGRVNTPELISAVVALGEAFLRG